MADGEEVEGTEIEKVSGGTAVAVEPCDLPDEEKRSITCKPGVAPIKSRFIKEVCHGVKKPVRKGENEGKEEVSGDTSNEPPKKKKRGMNKNRPRYRRADPHMKLCNIVVHEQTCPQADSCRFNHNVADYMSSKPADIGDRCIIFDKYGKCPYGVTCRYGKDHISEGFKNIVNEELCAKGHPCETKNTISRDIQHALRKKTYKFPAADYYIAQLQTVVQEGRPLSELADLPKTRQTSGALTDEDVVKTRPQEKKKVGNLPFRRVCKQYGADVTCSEMAVATNLLQGQNSEWALLKRHSSEDVFGVQVCGSFADSMAKCAEMLQNEVEMDFVDINVGCPIDLVFKKGGGCALMGRYGKFEKIVRGMKHVLDVPLTVKLRTGISDKKKTWNAHKLIFSLKDWGVSLVTVHGRSREQRYTKTADWEYINECAKAAAPLPLFGNGDVLSYEDALLRREQTGVAGLMVARGALIKPWIFTEIKEQRHWDISSRERLEMLQNYTNFGLQHWGSDTQGVENTRRFLLEWLSFLCRYIPVGLLERLPQRINDRPPSYYGRDDLETLMASPDCADWVKITEMLLGPVPADFTFIPKHRANSYTPSEG